MARSDRIALHTYVRIVGWPCHFRRACNLGLQRILCGEVDGDRRIELLILFSLIHCVRYPGKVEQMSAHDPKRTCAGVFRGVGLSRYDALS